MTVPFSWRAGKARVFITPGPNFVHEKPEGEVVVDSTGAVKKVSTSVFGLLCFAGRTRVSLLHHHRNCSKHD